MRLINADKLHPDCMTKDGKLAISQSQLANAPTVELRLMTVEECAGHTIDYAMGWKACIEWLKKGSDMRGNNK